MDTAECVFSPPTKHVIYNSHSTHMYAGNAARRRRFAGEYNLGRVRGGKWKG